MFFIPSIEIRIAAILTVLVFSPAGGNCQSAYSDRIHQGDLIEVDELGGFDHDWRGNLSPEGFLDGFTKVSDPVFARCKTTDELAEAVKLEYSKFLRAPSVRVRILDKSKRPLTYLEGAIKQPVRLQIKREIFLKEVIVVGGGFTDQTSGEITIFRPDNQSCEPVSGEDSRLKRIKIADILSGRAEANPKIVSGDIVTVHPVQPVYVLGGVASPGKISWRDGATISRIVAAAGGVSNKGVSGTVSIYRREPAGGNRVIQVDLDKITQGNSSDVDVKPFDIIEVPLKGSAKRETPPVVDDSEVLVAQPRLAPLRVID